MGEGGGSKFLCVLWPLCVCICTWVVKKFFLVYGPPNSWRGSWIPTVGTTGWPPHMAPKGGGGVGTPPFFLKWSVGGFEGVFRYTHTPFLRKIFFGGILLDRTSTVLAPNAATFDFVPFAREFRECMGDALFWAPGKAWVRWLLLIFPPFVWGSPRMQGWHSISAHFWAPEKAGLRWPLLILILFVGKHF